MVHLAGGARRATPASVYKRLLLNDATVNMLESQCDSTADNIARSAVRNTLGLKPGGGSAEK